MKSLVPLILAVSEEITKNSDGGLSGVDEFGKLLVKANNKLVIFPLFMTHVKTSSALKRTYSTLSESDMRNMMRENNLGVAGTIIVEHEQLLKEIKIKESFLEQLDMCFGDNDFESTLQATWLIYRVAMPVDN